MQYFHHILDHLISGIGLYFYELRNLAASLILQAYD